VRILLTGKEAEGYVKYLADRPAELALLKSAGAVWDKFYDILARETPCSTEATSGMGWMNKFENAHQAIKAGVPADNQDFKKGIYFSLRDIHDAADKATK
jgi:hypothetical protein